MAIKFVLLLALFMLTMVTSGLLVAGNSKDSAKKAKLKCRSGQYYSKSSFLTNKPRCNTCPDTLQECQDGQPADRASCTKDCGKLHNFSQIVFAHSSVSNHAYIYRRLVVWRVTNVMSQKGKRDCITNCMFWGSFDGLT